MCQKRHWMEQTVSLALIAYAIGLEVAETLRAHVFPETSRKRRLYSGFLVLLKLKLALPYPEFRKIHSLILLVRTFV